MLADNLKSIIENATVTITKKGGRGILVPGPLVLTVAHCVDFSCDYPMAHDFHFVKIRTHSSKEFNLAPYAIEPCYDVAALGELDNQQPAFEPDVEAFELFYEETPAVHLCDKDFDISRPFPIHVYTREKNG